ncbi:glycosyltransferase family 2 protein [Aeromicrobium chenweiae]|uniref:glycosyltransferase family 2 protein n=1 Tax=Aeromicrobium chenweiae TaxID=2079793 RepID=UPI00131EE9E7|nr:glycosyltransferase family A protein [Aeromicrobium chenweiae]
MIVRPAPLRTRPRVSVVIPCYNYGQFLPTAVGSVLDQAGLDVDVLIVDDASTDDSLDVAAALAAADDRVAVLAHERNAGHIATYNDGLAEVRGDYVVLLSADDAVPRNALTRAVTLMENHPGVGLVYGFPENFEDHLRDVPDVVRSWSVWSGQDWLERICRKGKNVIMSPEVVMRRAAWDEISSYDPRLPHAADMAIWLRTAQRWDIGRVNGPPQAFYRVHGENMHLTTYAGMITDLRERSLVFDLLLGAGSAAGTADAARLHAMARRALARTAVRLAVNEGIGADPDAPTDELADFARTLWPPVQRTREWQRYSRSARTDVVRPPKVTFAGRARTHLAWRQWRRYGT